jgi:hypothetical protein
MRTPHRSLVMPSDLNGNSLLLNTSSRKNCTINKLASHVYQKQNESDSFFFFSKTCCQQSNHVISFLSSRKRTQLKPTFIFFLSFCSCPMPCSFPLLARKEILLTKQFQNNLSNPFYLFFLCCKADRRASCPKKFMPHRNQNSSVQAIRCKVYAPLVAV